MVKKTTTKTTKPTAKKTTVAKKTTTTPKTIVKKTVTAKTATTATTAKTTKTTTIKARKTVNSADRYQMVAQTAYLMAEKRGFVNGNQDDDWLSAEKKVAQMLEG